MRLDQRLPMQMQENSANTNKLADFDATRERNQSLGTDGEHHQAYRSYHSRSALFEDQQISSGGVEAASGRDDGKIC
jgi:hypothetical protein